LPLKCKSATAGEAGRIIMMTIESLARRRRLGATVAVVLGLVLVGQPAVAADDLDGGAPRVEQAI
jgi:hypothetical protein